ncbi:transcription termination factor MTERF2, chloroplastic isoform X2 [Humulus lupulus]|uniref:transcription termination factor MTERF2, chloroplastic isoform X2 n=1 Tax=Humulus lupulus TaxID=3486 RepID=UPI002B408A51|nr:transcription termination factor MTERF2, chloroplastic isoform X2 [Humulus lupulus]
MYVSLLATKMLSSPSPPCHYHSTVYNPRASVFHRSNSNSGGFHHLKISKIQSRASTSGEPTPELNPRNHNSKSMALLLHHLSNQSQSSNPKREDLEHPRLSAEERVRLLELSLVQNRTPQFPGSVYVQSPSDADVSSSLPPLQTLFRDGDFDEDNDQEMIMRAVEIRRKVTAEIFLEAMRRGKFGITYSSNLVSKLDDFIDYVMVEAASLKRLPEFSNSNFNVRAKTVIHDSNVVPLIRWLKHNSLSYPQIRKLICMSKGDLESIIRLANWLKSMHVKGRFIGLAMLKGGESVFKRGSEELDEIFEYLERNGVRKEWTGYVLSRCPQLLSYSFEEIKTRVGFFLDMGMNDKDFGTMVFDYPRILGYFTLTEMSEKVNYLKEFGLSIEEVGKLLAFKPELMSCSIEERWKPLVKYLYYHGISRDGMRRMLTIKPMVFCVDLEMTIVPKVIFLMTRAGVTKRDIAKVIASGPELLGCSIVHKLEINMKYYLSLGIRLQQLGEMIADFPMLLRYNLDVLRPKYRYLRRTMVRPLEDVIEFPRFFSYSLESRIIPRHKILVENRVNMKLRYMLGSTDEELEKKIQDIRERRQRFESTIVNDEFFSPEKEIDDDFTVEQTLIDTETEAK